MKKSRLVALVTLILLSVFIFTSCTTGQVPSITPDSELSSKDSKEPEKSDPPAKFSMFYQEANQNFPDGFKHNDNWFINYICEKANVELTEVNVPAYMDTQTKFNLMMSSGDIPDLVERADAVAMKQYGMEGAFMPTKDIIRNSPAISSFYDDVQLQAMESEDGTAYVIQIPPLNDDYDTMWVRQDLLEKMGYQEEPKTLDEWVQACRDLKKYDPNSMPLASMVDLGAAWITFVPFNIGQNGCGWMYYPERGKVSNVWEGDNIVRSVRFGKMLYDESLWDKEFITTTGDEYMQKKLRNNVLLHYNNIGSLGIWIERFINDDQSDVRLVPTMMPMADDVGVDKWYKSLNVLGGYAFGINAKTKELDGIIRFLEVLYSPEVKEMAVYGREGIEFKKENNDIVPIFPAAAEGSWRNLYGWVYVNNIDTLNYRPKMLINASTKLNDNEKTEYIDLLFKADKNVRDQIYGHLDYEPMSLALPIEDNLRNLASQAVELQKSLIAKAIMGEISIDDFIAEKDNLVKKYQDVTDAYNKNVEAAKAQYNLK